MTRQIPEEEIRRARAVKERHERSLMALPKVTGVGVGASRREPGRAAIVVYVSGRLSAVERRRFPEELEGVDVEVIEAGPFRALAEGGIPFSELRISRCPAARQPEARLIRTRAAWRAFLREAGARTTGPAPDFRRGTIVVILAGERPTGGYRVEIEKVVEAPGAGGAVKVYYRVVGPRAGAVAPEGATYPCAAIAIPKKLATVSLEPPLPVRL